MKCQFFISLFRQMNYLFLLDSLECKLDLLKMPFRYLIGNTCDASKEIQKSSKIHVIFIQKMVIYK